LTEKGQTALGPALVVSIGLAAQKAGSQVILCTDGLANIGLGNLDVISSGQDAENTDIDTVTQWYEQIANWALENGVVVNVISITDSECKLENLGKVCDITQGKVQRINPLELTTNFKGILEKKVLATKVQATMLLHPVLRFKTDGEDGNDAIDVEMRDLQEKPSSPLSKTGQVKLDKIDELQQGASNQEEQQEEQQQEEQQEKKQEQQEQQQEPEPEKLKEKENLEEEKKLDIEISRQVQDIGNVFQDSKIYFEYVLRKDLLKEKKSV